VGFATQSPTLAISIPLVVYYTRTERVSGTKRPEGAVPSSYHPASRPLLRNCHNLNTSPGGARPAASLRPIENRPGSGLGLSIRWMILEHMSQAQLAASYVSAPARDRAICAKRLAKGIAMREPMHLQHSGMTMCRSDASWCSLGAGPILTLIVISVAWIYSIGVTTPLNPVTTLKGRLLLPFLKGGMSETQVEQWLGTPDEICPCFSGQIARYNHYGLELLYCLSWRSPGSYELSGVVTRPPVLLQGRR
jgi:hypothetical protein